MYEYCTTPRTHTRNHIVFPCLSDVMHGAFPDALAPSRVTIVAYGALLSEASSRVTFPSLSNFRLVRVRGMRRLFGMTHLFLTSEGIADMRTLRCAALSVERADDCSFIGAAYEVELDDEQRAAFCEREMGYDITTCSFSEMPAEAPSGTGVICAASSDHQLGADFPWPPGVSTIWDWSPSSGLRPADVYLRHCLLAMAKIGGEAEHSFLHDTTLVDRKTSLHQYLTTERKVVMAATPPTALATRFGG